MAKKPKENKTYTPPKNKIDLFDDLEAQAEEANAEEAKAEENQVVMVKVKILPLRGIGGYGTAGDEVWMPEAEAEYYKRDGYVEILKEE